MRYDQWLQLRLGLLACYRGEPAARSSSAISPEYVSVWLIHEGNAEIRSSGKSFRIKAGQGVLLPPGPRQQELSEDLSFHSISFFADWPDGRSLFPQNTPCIFRGENPVLMEVMDEIHEIFSQSLSHNSFFSFREQVPLQTFLELQQQLPRFLNRLLPILASENLRIIENRELDARVIRAIELMENYDWTQGPLSQPELAEHCGISASHLDRLFRLQLDCPPAKWMNRLRSRRARQLLQSRSLPVKHIAYELGFRSLSHFSRWYREQTGHPPSREKGTWI